MKRSKDFSFRFYILDLRILHLKNSSTDSKVRTTLYSVINRTMGNALLSSFQLNGPLTRKLEPCVTLFALGGKGHGRLGEVGAIQLEIT